MSALGHKRTFRWVRAMSLCPRKRTFASVITMSALCKSGLMQCSKIAGRLKSLELRDKVMRKEVQEALESAIAGFEERQQAKHERLRERERFEADWARIRTAVVLPALEEIAVVLRKAGWQCEVRAGDKDPGIHFTVYREVKAGVSGGERPYMSYQLEKQKDTVLVNAATKGSAGPIGSFTLDKITEDFVQTEATKFFARAASEAG